MEDAYASSGGDSTAKTTKCVRAQLQYEAASTDSVTDHVGSSVQAEAATMD